MRNDWKHYQLRLKRRQKRFDFARKAARAGRFFVPAVLLLVGLVLFLALNVPLRVNAGGKGGQTLASTTWSERLGVTSQQTSTLGKKELAEMVRCAAEVPDRPDLLRTRTPDGQTVYLQTTVDPALQRYVQLYLEGSRALSGAFVAIDPDTGRVLAMASHDPVLKEDLCLRACPAASIIKIVTAAAAIESRGMQPTTQLYYDGRPHTLYKSNLKPGSGKWSNAVTLEDAFARSINMVFGKLGAFELGPQAMDDYARRFHFNQAIPFERPLEVSRIQVPADDYGLAQIASGFNRETTITPLHGALMAACAVNGGCLPEPAYVQRVMNLDWKPVYELEPARLAQAISPQAAANLRQMMEATVREGTCRRTLTRELYPVGLGRLEVGGKTGSIFSQGGAIKYDWFVGYAIDRETGKKIACGAVQMHGKYLGLRSTTIAGLAMRKYFDLSPLPPPDPARARRWVVKSVSDSKKKSPAKRSRIRHRARA